MATKSIHAIQTSVTSEIKFCFKRGMRSSDITKKYRELIDNHCYTESGNKRIAQKDIDAICFASFSIQQCLADIYTVFGYWYEGEFYTTYKGTKHKTTDDLRKHNPTMDCKSWDKLESGLYYIDSLKPYYISTMG